MRRSNRSYILLEILLSLLIFAVAAWICLTLFGMGAKAAKRADELSNAPQICASLLESARSEECDYDYYYDADWQQCASVAANVRYRVSVRLSENGLLTEATAELVRLEDGSSAYTLSTAWLSKEVSR